LIYFASLLAVAVALAVALSSFSPRCRSLLVLSSLSLSPRSLLAVVLSSLSHTHTEGGVDDVGKERDSRAAWGRRLGSRRGRQGKLVGRH
jgi:hypothetical protein